MLRLLVASLLFSSVSCAAAKAAAHNTTAVEVDASGALKHSERKLKESGATSFVVDERGKLVQEDLDDDAVVKPKERKVVMRSQQSSEQDDSLAQSETEEEDLVNDATLDELEAITIAASLQRKTAESQPIDCQWSDWENERPCTKSCGGGMQFKIRVKSVHEVNGGRQCEGRDFKVDDCDNNPCPTTQAPTTPAPTTTPFNGDAHKVSAGLLVFSVVLAALHA